jgi:hypothetical protein
VLVLVLVVQVPVGPLHPQAPKPRPGQGATSRPLKRLLHRFDSGSESHGIQWGHQRHPVIMPVTLTRTLDCKLRTCKAWFWAMCWPVTSKSGVVPDCA